MMNRLHAREREQERFVQALIGVLPGKTDDDRERHLKNIAGRIPPLLGLPFMEAFPDLVKCRKLPLDDYMRYRQSLAAFAGWERIDIDEDRAQAFVVNALISILSFVAIDAEVWLLLGMLHEKISESLRICWEFPYRHASFRDGEQEAFGGPMTEEVPETELTQRMRNADHYHLTHFMVYSEHMA